MHVDATRTNYLAARGAARVAGAHVGSDAVAQHVLRTDADVNATANDLRSWKTSMLATISRRAVEGTFPGCVLGSPVDSCMTDAERSLNKLITYTWDPFATRWKAYASSTTYYAWDESEVGKYDTELASYRAKIQELVPGILVSPTTPPSAKSDESTLGKAVDSVSNLIWLVGIGAALYLGAEFVLPLFIGAAGKTKSAYRGYQGVGA